MTTVGPAVFLSYRRKESSHAGRLHDRLVERLGEDRVFMDVDSIRPGEDWTEAISRAFAKCGVMLVLIGDQWGQVRSDSPARIGETDDPVRFEIEAAFDQGIPIIPVLLEDAVMPRHADLPATLVKLSHLQAMRVRHETFKSDAARLLTVVEEVLDAYEDEGNSSRAYSVVNNILAPHETARADRSSQQIAEHEVDQLYDYALAAFWTEQWDEAVDLLGQVLDRQPEHADAARKLELARHQQELASAELVDKPDRGRTPAAVVDENVQFTVYRPNAVQSEVWYPLLAFAHLAERRPDAPPGQPDPLEQVQALAEQVLGAALSYPVTRVDARAGVPREGQLTFVPFVEGVDFNPRSQTFEWQEDVHQQNFRLKARADTVGSVLRGQLTVYLGAFILADVDLAFRADLAAPPPPTPNVRPATTTLLATSSASPTPPEPELTPVTAVPYQKVFPSYSHKDLAIVRQAEVYGKALGHVYLRDRLALRSGEEWEVRLLELIDEADIFQLFWSSNSMKSEYVRREYEHAYALGRRGFIRPTYWEVPMPQSTNPRLPPDELAKLHFHGFFEESDDEEFASTRAREIQLRDARREAEERYGRVAEEQARRVAEERARRVAREAEEPERPRSRPPGRIRSQPSARPRSQAPARSTRRLWLIAVIVFLVVLVAVEVVILIRG